MPDQRAEAPAKVRPARERSIGSFPWLTAAGRIALVRPVFRWSLGLLWLATAALSFGLYPVEDSFRMLSQVGLHGVWAEAALYGGAGLHLALGLPAEYWMHPFAPLLKNLPVAAAPLAMTALEA
jgi:hypothetical protein